MNVKLMFEALRKYVMGFLWVALFLFVPAGTLKFMNAWLFIGLLFIPIFMVGAVLFFKNPSLLKKRLRSDEKEDEQKSVLLLGNLMFSGGFIIAGLDYRFKWFVLPKMVVIIASIVFLLGYLLFVLVLKENEYLSRTVEIQEDQIIVDTGLYGFVRHPMYLATLLLFLSMPLVLGSVFSFFIFLIYPIIIVKRIKNEEKVLEVGLVGYKDYMKKVKYRLIPFVW